MSYGSVFEESGSAGSDYLYFRDGYYGSEKARTRTTAEATEQTAPVETLPAAA